MKLFLIYIFGILNLCSCGIQHHNHLISKPINVDTKAGKWLIDEPLLDKVEVEFESVAIDYYREFLSGRFKDFKTISDYSKISTLKKITETNSKALEIYKQQTNCDYLISTKIEMIRCDDPQLRALAVTILVRDLNTTEIIFKNEYHSRKRIKASNTGKLKKFINASIEMAISDFSKKENWKYFSKK